MWAVETAQNVGVRSFVEGDDRRSIGDVQTLDSLGDQAFDRSTLVNAAVVGQWDGPLSAQDALRGTRQARLYDALLFGSSTAATFDLVGSGRVERSASYSPCLLNRVECERVGDWLLNTTIRVPASHAVVAQIPSITPDDASHIDVRLGALILYYAFIEPALAHTAVVTQATVQTDDASDSYLFEVTESGDGSVLLRLVYKGDEKTYALPAELLGKQKKGGSSSCARWMHYLCKHAEEGEESYENADLKELVNKAVRALSNLFKHAAAATDASSVAWLGYIDPAFQSLLWTLTQNVSLTFGSNSTALRFGASSEAYTCYGIRACILCESHLIDGLMGEADTRSPVRIADDRAFIGDTTGPARWFDNDAEYSVLSDSRVVFAFVQSQSIRTKKARVQLTWKNQGQQSLAGTVLSRRARFDAECYTVRLCLVAQSYSVNAPPDIVFGIPLLVSTIPDQASNTGVALAQVDPVVQAWSVDKPDDAVRYALQVLSAETTVEGLTALNPPTLPDASAAPSSEPANTLHTLAWLIQTPAAKTDADSFGLVRIHTLPRETLTAVQSGGLGWWRVFLGNSTNTTQGTKGSVRSTVLSPALSDAQQRLAAALSDGTLFDGYGSVHAAVLRGGSINVAAMSVDQEAQPDALEGARVLVRTVDALADTPAWTQTDADTLRRNLAAIHLAWHHTTTRSPEGIRTLASALTRRRDDPRYVGSVESGSLPHLVAQFVQTNGGGVFARPAKPPAASMLQTAEQLAALGGSGDTRALSTEIARAMVDTNTWRRSFKALNLKYTGALGYESMRVLDDGTGTRVKPLGVSTAKLYHYVFRHVLPQMLYAERSDISSPLRVSWIAADQNGDVSLVDLPQSVVALLAFVNGGVSLPSGVLEGHPLPFTMGVVDQDMGQNDAEFAVRVEALSAYLGASAPYIPVTPETCWLAMITTGVNVAVLHYGYHGVCGANQSSALFGATASEPDRNTSIERLPAPLRVLANPGSVIKQYGPGRAVDPLVESLHQDTMHASLYRLPVQFDNSATAGIDTFDASAYTGTNNNTAIMPTISAKKATPKQTGDGLRCVVLCKDTLLGGCRALDRRDADDARLIGAVNALALLDLRRNTTPLQCMPWATTGDTAYLNGDKWTTIPRDDANGAPTAYGTNQTAFLSQVGQAYSALGVLNQFTDSQLPRTVATANTFCRGPQTSGSNRLFSVPERQWANLAQIPSRDFHPLAVHSSTLWAKLLCNRSENPTAQDNELFQNVQRFAPSLKEKLKITMDAPTTLDAIKTTTQFPQIGSYDAWFKSRRKLGAADGDQGDSGASGAAVVAQFVKDVADLRTNIAALPALITDVDINVLRNIIPLITDQTKNNEAQSFVNLMDDEQSRAAQYNDTLALILKNFGTQTNGWADFTGSKIEQDIYTNAKQEYERLRDSLADIAKNRIALEAITNLFSASSTTQSSSSQGSSNGQLSSASDPASSTLQSSRTPPPSTVPFPPATTPPPVVTPPSPAVTPPPVVRPPPIAPPISITGPLEESYKSSDLLGDVVSQIETSEIVLVTDRDLQRILEVNERRVNETQRRLELELKELRAASVPNARKEYVPLTDKEEQDLAKEAADELALTPDERLDREIQEQIRVAEQKAKLQDAEILRLKTTFPTAGGVSLYEQRVQQKIKAREKLVSFKVTDLHPMFQ